jgi:hypothetical protein
MAESAETNWKQLAEAVCNETDSEKLMGLVEQLNRALAELMQDRYQHPEKDRLSCVTSPRHLCI